MSLELLTESFIYGNIDLVFTSDKIKNFNIEVIKDFPLGDYIEEESFPWRLFNNFNYFLNCYENYILNKEEKFLIFLESITHLITKYYSYLSIKDTFSFEEPKTNKDFLYINVIVFFDKVISKLNMYQKTKKINIERYLKNFLQFYSDINIFYDNVTPYDDLKWTSKWKLITSEKEINLKNIDIYLDSYFKNHHIYYNENMEEDVNKFFERMVYLKSKAPRYFSKLENKIYIITEKIFYTFPYKVIYQDYKKLIISDFNVFKPKLLNDKEFTDERWILSIIPRFLTAYLLGIPVIKIDVPGYKILDEKIKILDNLGTEKYFKKIAEDYNKKNIESSSFEIKGGNVNDEEILDLCYLKIIDYNQDDILTIVNDNVIHYFSCREFETIWKKQENPYNREKITNMTKIIENLKFKKRVSKSLLTRGLELYMEGTMIENFQELKENILHIKTPTIQISRNELNDIYRPLVEIFLSNNQQFY